MSSQPDLSGRVALVTGASRGIGEATARGLDAAGARVVLVSRDAGALDAVAAACAHDPVVVAADLADVAEITRVVGEALGAAGRIDVLVNNAAAGVRVPIETTDAALVDGLLALNVRALAMELGPLGIRVNSVAPGVVDTAMWAANKKVPGVVESVEALTPLGRWGTPADIAGVIVFLASDAARFVTGETIAVDGGMARTIALYG